MKNFDELWPLPCPEIVIVTGGFGVGKSTFTLGTGATPERTFVCDFEKSQKSFAAQLPLTYVDMQARMGELYPSGYKMINLFKEICAVMDAIEPGKYDILVLDNASNLEDAITAYVEANPGEFGHSTNQYNSMSGLKWADVKNKYQQLLTRWVSKARMIFIIVHLRDKWAGNSIIKDAFGKPVQEPKGKETLDQLSSLFVWLEAGPGAIPAARVLKCRMDRKVYVADPDTPPDGIPAKYLAELHGEPGLVSIPVLPLRLPKCTWPAIRDYMRNPADLSNPKPGEMPTEAQMSDDDRLRLRAIIADREAEKASIDLLKMGQSAPSSSYNRSGASSAPHPTTPPPAGNGHNNGSNNVSKPAEQKPPEQKQPAPATQPSSTPAPGASRTPDQVKAFIDDTAAHWAGKKISDGKRGLIAPMLEACFAAGDASAKRHQVQLYLTGKASIRDIPDNYLIAIYMWLGPSQDTGGQWLPLVNATREANAIIASLDAQPGQMNLLDQPTGTPAPATVPAGAPASVGAPAPSGATADWRTLLDEPAPAAKS